MELAGLEGVAALFSEPRLGLLARIFVEERGAGLFLVGGAVRDRLLGFECPDIDLAVDCDPEEPARHAAEALGATLFPLDAKRRVFRLVGQGWSLDISPLKGRDIIEDLAARDFTVNSVALEYRPEGALLHDPLGGLKDMEAGVVRASSKKSFVDDPLRILRGFRLFAQLGWRMDAKTLSLIWGAVDRVSDIARERVRDEFFNILDSQRTFATLMSMDRYGLLPEILPELGELAGIDQGRHHRVNLFTHTFFTVAGVETLERELPRAFGGYAARVEELLGTAMVEMRTVRALLKLTALWHDLGKPETRTVDGEGDVHFYGHEKIGAHKALAAAQSLMLSNRETNIIRDLVRDHLKPAQLLRARVKKGRGVARLFGPGEERGLMLLCLFAADHLAKGGGKTLDELKEFFVGWLDFHARVLEKRRLEKPLVTGRDLLEMGFSPGPELGRVLRQVNSLFWEGDISEREEGLRLAKVHLEKQNS